MTFSPCANTITPLYVIERLLSLIDDPDAAVTTGLTQPKSYDSMISE